MAAITFNRLEGQYSYSFESSTQSNDLKLLIDQSDKDLKISIINKRGLEFPVEGLSIRGLPKTSKVPKAFFENAYSNVQKRSDGSYSVSFSVRGLGGWKPATLQFTATNRKTLVFSKFNSNFSELRGKQGLYVFINDKDDQRVYAYIGESSDLGDRLDGHEMLEEEDHVYVCILNGLTLETTRKNYESEMIKARCPYRNTQHATHC